MEEHKKIDKLFACFKLVYLVVDHVVELVNDHDELERKARDIYANDMLVFWVLL